MEAVLGRAGDELVQLEQLDAQLGRPCAQVGALPKTRSAKIVRRAVRARALGEDPGDLSSLENPEALDEISAGLL